MMMPHCLRRAAVALLVASVAVIPAGAMAKRGTATAETTETTSAGCTDCAKPMADGARSTRSVNVAILVLGTLWMGLMVRRIQLRSAMGDLHDGLRDGVPQPVAGGR